MINTVADRDVIAIRDNNIYENKEKTLKLSVVV